MSVVKRNGDVAEISAINANVLWSTMFDDSPDGLYLHFIQFNPAAEDDSLTVRNGATGPVIFYTKCTGDNDQRIVYYQGVHLSPVIDYAASTLTAGASVLICRARTL